MIKYIILALLVSNLGFASPKETEKKGTNPVHQMYLDLKAQGYSMPEIADRIASSEEMRQAVTVFPLEDCYREVSQAFERDAKTCTIFPPPQQAGCFASAQAQSVEARRVCGATYGGAALFYNNTGNTTQPNPQPQTPAPQVSSEKR